MVAYYIFGDEDSGNVKNRAMGLTRIDTSMARSVEDERAPHKVRAELFKHTTSTQNQSPPPLKHNTSQLQLFGKSVNTAARPRF